MPVHDWTRVEAGIFHAFHLAWIGGIQNALNDHGLPDGYYALAEQHAGRAIPDILALHVQPDSAEPTPRVSGTGGLAVAEAPPKVRRRQSIEHSLLARRRTLAIRHVSGHQLVALLEIIFPANKDRRTHVEAFAAKAVEALAADVHLLLVDLFPPGPHDPGGMHGVIRQMLDDAAESYELPTGEPMTLASYAAGPDIEVYLEHLAPGATLVDMPLFLSSERYVPAPLDSTYEAAWRGMPAFWRDVLEGTPPR